MNTDRPLDGVASIKVKLGLLVGASVVVAVVVAGVGEVAEVPWWMSVPVTVAAALAVTQWLARGMTSPLREMTAAARRMAAGDYAQRVTATSSDEVGTLGRAFNAMAADLATADQQRRQLVATVSHELRTPLTAQRALLENLVDGVVRPDDDALRAALTQSRTAQRPGRRPARPVPHRRRRRAAGAHRGAGRRPARRGRGRGPRRRAGRCWCATRRTRPTSPCVADPARLAQLVANLVDNAVRHSPPQGEVRVVARARRRRHLVARGARRGPRHPRRPVERVFDRFGSGDDSARRHRPGPGDRALGLRAARRHHHGAADPHRNHRRAPARRPAPARPRRPAHPPPSGEDRVRTDHPHDQTPPAAPAPTPADPGAARRPRAPAGARCGRRCARRHLARAGRAGAAPDRARRPGHRRVGGPDLAGAQRRPRRVPHDARAPAC